jgi:large subunit ribosomal protein L4
MATIEIKSKDGKAAGKHTLSEALSAGAANPTLLHRAVVTEEANARQGTQSAKTRSEVRGGGRKPYRQKKTGRARQGSIRSPLYAHGGMALAVKPRDYEKQLNRKERRAAILAALSAKIEAGDATIVDGIVFAEPRTKHAVELLKKLELGDSRRVLIVLPAYDAATFKCFRNLPNVTVKTAPGSGGDAKTAVFSARDVAVAHKVVLDKDALKKIEEVWAK